jgi:hypothetical protein
LDELQRNAKPVAVQPKSPPQTGEKPSEDLGGWRPVAPRQDSAEAVNQPREINR